jgi:RNA recognition motif-containing protein
MNSVLLSVLVIIALLVVIISFILIKRKRGNNEPEAVIEEQIYVGNLAYRVGERELDEVFAQYGKVLSSRVIRHPRSRRSKGFAFVTYGSSKEANDAIDAHGHDFYGRSMVVRLAKAKQH